MDHTDESRVRGHAPVMTDEMVAWLEPGPDKCILDCTVGAGGHSRALLEAGAGRIIGLDRDREALSVAEGTLSSWSRQVELVHADHREIDDVLDRRGVPTVDGAIADLGMSSMQIDGEGRGFSFRRDEPLDMRMDRSQGPTVADLLRDVSEHALADVIFRYGEELAALVRRAVPWRGRPRIDPATRTFQALRVWVNNELDGLDAFLQSVCKRLVTGARFVVIAFHSLEDRVVKTVFRELGGKSGDGESLVRVLTKRPMRPTLDEVSRNPRARSAELRAAERGA